MRPTRAQLVERKRQLEGEIAVRASDLKRRIARGEPIDTAEAQLSRLRDQHYRLRLQIDRTAPED